MKKPLDTVGALLLLTGLAGVVHHFVDWFHLWGLIRVVPVLRDHDLPSGIALAVLGLTMLVTVDTLARRDRT